MVNKMSDFRGSSKYVVSDELMNAINIAICPFKNFFSQARASFFVEKPRFFLFNFCPFQFT